MIMISRPKNAIGIYEGGGGLFAVGGGLFAAGPFAAVLIAGGLFASGLNAAPHYKHPCVDPIDFETQLQINRESRQSAEHVYSKPPTGCRKIVPGCQH